MPELRVDQLESKAEVQSLPSVISESTDTILAITLMAASTKLAEMKALAEKLAAVNAQQHK